MNSKVSIILPVYNWEYFIQQTLDSVFTQTHKNRELIIINDCSTDQSEKIIDPYLNDPRVIYIKNEKNLNIVWSRNI